MKIAAGQGVVEYAEETELVPSLLPPEVHAAITVVVDRAGLESGGIKPW